MVAPRRDIVESLKEALVAGMVPGTSDSDINVYALPITVTRAHLQLAIDEIQRLRAILRTCAYGMEVIDIGGGEFRGLYLPNKEKPPHD